MDCHEARDNLDMLARLEHCEPLRIAVEEHVKICPACSAELDLIQQLSTVLAADASVEVPAESWTGIAARLAGDHTRSRAQRIWSLARKPQALAASILLVVGVGLVATLWSGGSSSAQAAAIDFGALLDGAQQDVRVAFDQFLQRYGARPIPPERATSFAPRLNLEVPPVLPAGFERQEVYGLNFNGQPGVAAAYRKNGQLLITIFHTPIQAEDYGTHKDRPCVVGDGHGHKVEVGQWKLVHLTDPTTCHCVLSKLDEQRELPAVMRAIAPRFRCNCGCQDTGRP